MTLLKGGNAISHCVLYSTVTAVLYFSSSPRCLPRCQRIKTEFTFEYSYLEDELPV